MTGAGEVPERCREQVKQEARRSDANPPTIMKSNRALLLTLMTIGISGGSGRPIPQEIPRSADLISVALSGSTTLTVSNTLGFISGDYVRIDDGTVHGYHTVVSASEGSITITSPRASPPAVRPL